MNQVWRSRLFALVGAISAIILIFKQYNIAEFTLIPIPQIGVEITVGVVLGLVLLYLTYLIFKQKLR